MDARTVTTDELLSRDAILEAVAFAAERLLQAARWEDAMDGVLERLGTATNASRVYLFENRTDEEGVLRTSQRFEWCGPGIRPVIDDPDLQDQPWIEAGFQRWVEILTGGEPVYGLIKDFPEAERLELESQDIISTLSFPLMVGGNWWGTIGFDDCTSERLWLPAEIEALRAASAIVSACILRQGTDEMLHEARERFRALVEFSPMVTYQEGIDAAGGTVDLRYLSPQIEGMFGYPVDRWQESDFWESLIHPDDHDAVVAEDDRTVAANATFDMEYRMLAADGRVIWVHDIAVPIRDEAGNVGLWQGSMVDVTTHKQATQSLRNVEARLRVLTENIPAITYIDMVDPKTPTLYISPQIEQILGYTQQDWIDSETFWHDCLHPDDEERVWLDWKLAIAKGTPFSSEYRMIRKDGSTVWISEQSVVLPDEKGEPRLLQGVLMDITEAKRAQEHARRAEERFRSLVERIPVAAYIENTDANPEGFFMAPQIETITGYAPDAFLDPNFWERHIHPEDRAGVVAEEARVEKSGQPFRVEYRFLAADGRTVWIREDSVRYRESRDSDPVWWGIIADITELKDAEAAREHALAEERTARERLQELDELKNTLLRAVSHDIRTPLSAMLGLAITLERPDIDLDPEDRRELAGRVVANARKLDRIVTDLLDLDRLSRGVAQLRLAPTDLAPLVGGLIDEQDGLKERDVIRDLQPTPVIVDPSKVERIVDNLLGNAVRHTGEGAHVWVRTGLTPEGALVVVEDDGPGVDPFERERIFEPFKHDEGGGGTGLGLSLVRKFAELHGGKAWVQEREGGGASFRVLLPSAEAETEEES